MKFKSTKRDIMANYGNIIKVDYCDLQNLLKYESPIAYTAGVYGWNADIYDFGGIAICTGYRLSEIFAQTGKSWKNTKRRQKIFIITIDMRKCAKHYRSYKKIYRRGTEK